jgi:hypothetical protein
VPNPRFPVYIISKGRHTHRLRLTSRHLEATRVPYSIVVEQGEYADYAAVIDPAKILILDPKYQRDFDTFWEFPEGTGKGSGPARNFVWDHAVAAGAERHWIMDDNIDGFFRLNHNLKVPVADGTVLRCMEDFVLRYQNVALAGPNYFMFRPRKSAMPPFFLNTRIYSCLLIRNDLPFRWRGRYNEDVDLSIRVLKAGYCTVQFNAFLQFKQPTQTMKGGNTDAFYRAEGTLPKSQMLVDMHPDVAQLTWKYGRWHHQVDYRPFKLNRLIRVPGLEVSAETDNYGMRLVVDPPAGAPAPP